MQRIKHLRDMLCDELCEYGEKDSLTAQDVDMIDKFAHAAKNLDKILAGPEGYSMDGHSTKRMYYDRAYEGRAYEGGASGDYSGRGRGPGAKRDSMGRYSSRDYAMSDYRD
jgi:hypothetical protein